jgi:glutamate formiminotransferase
MAKYILSDPNFSDGTHSEVIEKIIVVAVSCEISNPLKPPIHRVYNLLRDEAARYGVNVLAGQICGTIGAEVLVQTAEWYLNLKE